MDHSEQTARGTKGEPIAAKMQWMVIGAMAIVIGALISFSVSQVTARVSNVETDLRENKTVQTEINRDRESRLARLESIVSASLPEMKKQLDRIELKVDSHMSRDSR